MHTSPGFTPLQDEASCGGPSCVCISDLQGSVHICAQLCISPKTFTKLRWQTSPGPSPERTIMQVSTSSGQQGASLTQPLSTVSAKQVLLCTSQKAWKDWHLRSSKESKLQKKTCFILAVVRSETKMPQATNCNLFNSKNRQRKTTVVRRPWRRPCSRAHSASHRCGVRSPRARAPAPDLARRSFKIS